jgi:hypothetical protein
LRSTSDGRIAETLELATLAAMMAEAAPETLMNSVSGKDKRTGTSPM